MDNSKFKIQNLNFFLSEARKASQAIGHFNFATEDVAKAIVEAAKEAGAAAVMLGTSEGEAEFVGMKEAVAIVGALRDDYQFPVFLNADHFKSFETCKKAIDSGYDSILIDASKMPFEKNVNVTKNVVEYARSVSAIRSASWRMAEWANISVEGELGYLRGSSEVQQKVEITPDDYTKPEEAKSFVEQTSVDRLAVVFGNIHGVVTDQEEKLDINHLMKLIEVKPQVYYKSQVYYVLHGASGLKDEDVKAAIKAGVANVHFNTELRVAYHDALEKTLEANPSETTPYKYLAPSVEEVKKVVTQKIRLFTEV